MIWQPISLLFKNEPEEGSEYYQASMFSHRLLRVMVALDHGEGNDEMQKAYWEFASRLHNDEWRDFSDAESFAAEALTAIGSDPSYSQAADNDALDDEIRSRMDAGLALTGNDVGTPLIALDDKNGDKVALFGPVITRVPPTEESLELWDSFVTLARIPGFWELKRTRTEAPEFGDRPTP